MVVLLLSLAAQCYRARLVPVFTGGLIDGVVNLNDLAGGGVDFGNAALCELTNPWLQAQSMSTYVLFRAGHPL